jgi:hypothetical protein
MEKLAQKAARCARSSVRFRNGCRVITPILIAANKRDL